MSNKYKIGVNHARQRRFLRSARVFIIIVIVLLLIAGLFILIDAILQNRKANTPSEATTPVSSSIAPSIEIFTSPYFQFQTDKNWRFIANESTGTKFVYRRGTDNLVSGDMTVYINSGPADTQATRVLPVTLQSDPNKLKASFVSEHCSKNLAKEIRDTTGEITLTLNSVRFLCDADGTNYTIIVGLENGTFSMNFKRPDGTNATYIVFFRDLRFSAEPSEFETIMNSFQIR